MLEGDNKRKGEVEGGEREQKEGERMETVIHITCPNEKSHQSIKQYKCSLTQSFVLEREVTQ